MPAIRPAASDVWTIVRRFIETASLQARDRARLAGQLQDVQAGISAVDDVDVAALVGLDIVGLDRRLAALLAVDLTQRLSVASVIAGMK